jgi:hypothetical protein
MTKIFFLLGNNSEVALEASEEERYPAVSYSLLYRKTVTIRPSLALSDSIL